MKKIMALIFLLTSISFADSDFCNGFEEGYKTVKGDNVYVPYCPYEPYTPYNSTPRREGIKAGIKKANE